MAQTLAATLPWQVQLILAAVAAVALHKMELLVLTMAQQAVLEL
jgi:hypothetical protein